MRKYTDEINIEFVPDDSSADKAARDMGKKIGDTAGAAFNNSFDNATKNVGDKIAKTIKQKLKDVDPVVLDADVSKVINQIRRIKELSDSISTSIGASENTESIEKTIQLLRQELELRRKVYDTTNKYTSFFTNLPEVKAEMNIEGFNFKNTLEDIGLVKHNIKDLQSSLNQLNNSSVTDLLDEELRKFEKSLERVIEKTEFFQILK